MNKAIDAYIEELQKSATSNMDNISKADYYSYANEKDERLEFALLIDTQIAISIIRRIQNRSIITVKDMKNYFSVCGGWSHKLDVRNNALIAVEDCPHVVYTQINGESAYKLDDRG